MDSTEKYVPKEITNKKRTISSMRKNKKKRDNAKTSIFPLQGIYVMSEIIRKQNLVLLELIADEFINSEEEKETFIKQFSKPNYYVPEITETLAEENSQAILLKTMS